MRAHCLATALAVGLGLSAPAHAVDLGAAFSAELGNVRNVDPSWDLFSENNGMPSRGLRGGVKIGPHVTVQAGWHRVRRGSSIRVPVANGTDFDDVDVQMAFFADEFTLGSQFGVPIKDIVVPYASADGMLMRGVMKLDEDTETRKNDGQYTANGLLPGVVTAGGIELRTPMAPSGFQAAAFMEVGYSWFLRGDFDDFGQMKPGGLAYKGGVGIRF